MWTLASIILTTLATLSLLLALVILVVCWLRMSSTLRQARQEEEWNQPPSVSASFSPLLPSRPPSIEISLASSHSTRRLPATPDTRSPYYAELGQQDDLELAPRQEVEDVQGYLKPTFPSATLRRSRSGNWSSGN